MPATLASLVFGRFAFTSVLLAAAAPLAADETLVVAPRELGAALVVRATHADNGSGGMVSRLAALMA